MGQGLGDAKGSLGLFKGVRAPVESQVAGEWRADERLFVGVEDDATLSALLSMSCSLEIIDESFLAKVFRYLGSFPYLFYSLGVWNSSSSPFSKLDRALVCEGGSSDCYGMEGMEGEAILDPLRIVLVDGRVMKCVTRLEQVFAKLGVGFIKERKMDDGSFEGEEGWRFKILVLELFS